MGRISGTDGGANSIPECNIAVLAGSKVAPDSTFQSSTLMALLLVQRPLHRSVGMPLDCSGFQRDSELNRNTRNRSKHLKGNRVIGK